MRYPLSKETESSPEYWRNLALDALRRAEQATDPEVQHQLRSKAQDCMLRAALMNQQPASPAAPEPDPDAD